MKTIFKQSILVLMISLSLIGCSSDEDNVTPKFTYTDAVNYREGNDIKYQPSSFTYNKEESTDDYYVTNDNNKYVQHLDFSENKYYSYCYYFITFNDGSIKTIKNGDVIKFYDDNYFNINGGKMIKYTVEILFIR